MVRSLLVLLSLLALAWSTVIAQKIKSNYQLKNVQVQLTNGRVIQSRLLAFTEDSLSVWDRSKIPPGSLIAVHLPHNSKEVRCLVKAMSETHITVTNQDSIGEWTIARYELRDLRVIRFPLDDDQLDKFQRSSYHYKEIESLSLHRKGSGLLGGLIGFAIGGAVGYALHTEPPPPQNFAAAFSRAFSPPPGTSEAAIGGMIGMSLGILIATGNKKHYINGDRESFIILRRQVVRE